MDAIKKASEDNNICKQTVRNYLCLYLAFQSVSALVPQEGGTYQKKLTDDEKIFRWAINKYYFTAHKNSLKTCYTYMLKEKYCDADGKLTIDHPSYNQFRYFFSKYKKMQTLYISRNGMKDYQRNHRPLLRDKMEKYSNHVGIGEIDATICDIHLVDDKGNYIGRLNEISGGVGVTGVADTILMIECDDSTSKSDDLSDKDRTFYIVGRDVPEEELTIHFDNNNCRWKYVGTTKELNIKKKEEVYASSPIVKTIKALLDKNGGSWVGTSAELLEYGLKETGEPIAKSESALARKINKLDGMFEKDSILHVKPNKNGGPSGRKHCFMTAEKADTIPKSTEKAPEFVTLTVDDVMDDIKELSDRIELSI